MISIGELERIVDFDTGPGVALFGGADLDAYGKARAAPPALIAITKAAAAHLAASDSSAVDDDYWNPFFETKAKMRDALAGVTL